MRINDGSQPGVLVHDFQRYINDGPEATAAYLAKRYLVSRPDQLRYANLTVVGALLLTAIREYELGDVRA